MDEVSGFLIKFNKLSMKGENVMKKVWIFAVVVMLMAMVSAAQAEVRAGGLPPIVIDDSIKDCGCPPCCEEAIVLKIEFDTDKYFIRAKYNNEIKKVADYMKKYPNTTVVMEGHTDNVGDDAYNQELSQNRANSVKQYLVNNFGIKASRLTAIGYGESRPVASNDTEEGRQKNRRVQALFKK
jgi:OOP family OmpA-OmpF porin